MSGIAASDLEGSDKATKSVVPVTESKQLDSGFRPAPDNAHAESGRRDQISYLGSIINGFSSRDITLPNHPEEQNNRKRKLSENENSLMAMMKTTYYSGSDVDQSDDFVMPHLSKDMNSMTNSLTCDLKKTMQQTRDLCDDRNNTTLEHSRKIDFDKSDCSPKKNNSSSSLETMVVDDNMATELLPMKDLVQKLAEETRDYTVKEWTTIFSKVESFEITKLQQLDQILQSALAYELKLRNQKAELRQFLAKLTDVLKHD